MGASTVAPFFASNAPAILVDESVPTTTSPFAAVTVAASTVTSPAVPVVSVVSIVTSLAAVTVAPPSTRTLPFLAVIATFAEVAGLAEVVSMLAWTVPLRIVTLPVAEPVALSIVTEPLFAASVPVVSTVMSPAAVDLTVRAVPAVTSAVEVTLIAVGVDAPSLSLAVSVTDFEASTVAS